MKKNNNFEDSIVFWLKDHPMYLNSLTKQQIIDMPPVDPEWLADNTIRQTFNERYVDLRVAMEIQQHFVDKQLHFNNILIMDYDKLIDQVETFQKWLESILTCAPEEEIKEKFSAFEVHENFIKIFGDFKNIKR